MQLRVDGATLSGTEHAAESGPFFGRILLATGGRTVATHLLHAGRLIIGAHLGQ